MALTDVKVRTTKPTDKPVKLTDGEGMLLGLFKRKAITLARFLKEVQEDERHVAQLDRYEKKDLQYAEYQLEKKIISNENRVKVFFGKKTTVFALLAFQFHLWKNFSDGMSVCRFFTGMREGLATLTLSYGLSGH